MQHKEIPKILKQHHFKISQTSKDQRWRTYVKLANGKRHLIAKNTLEEVELELYMHYTGAKTIRKKVHTLETLLPI